MDLIKTTVPKWRTNLKIITDKVWQSNYLHFEPCNMVSHLVGGCPSAPRKHIKTLPTSRLAFHVVIYSHNFMNKLTFKMCWLKLTLIMSLLSCLVFCRWHDTGCLKFRQMCSVIVKRVSNMIWLAIGLFIELSFISYELFLLTVT